MSASEKPYRDNVAAVVLDDRGRVLVGWKHKGWQLPQGGVERGEDLRSALLRELAEEIGTDKFHIVRESAHWHCYDWPGAVAPHKQQYRGQRQRYFLVQFDGEESDIDVETHGEFTRAAWQTPATVLEQAWHVKRPIYRVVFEEFGLL